MDTLPIRVLLTDDHAIVRKGVRALLATERDIQVVGEAANGAEAVEKAEVLCPDVILMDLMMPKLDGIEATLQITAKFPSVRVIVLTSFAADEKVFPAIKAAVGDRSTLMLESGVRRGSDIVIARCLGARFALFGRPTLFGAAAGGAGGIARALQIVRNEIDMVMAQIGCSAFDSLDGRYLRTEGAGPDWGHVAEAAAGVSDSGKPSAVDLAIPSIRRQR